MNLQEAINIIRRYECCAEHYEACEMAIKALEKPERHGQWIVDEDGRIHCSACANIPTNRIMDVAQVLYDIHPLLMNYCPSCGAKMVGENK